MEYYDRRDLGKFAEVGEIAPDLMNSFFAYYNAATGDEGALSKREKALIGLAVSHVKQCPYCIEAYTSQCLATGADPEQMTEAIHVAAAVSAGSLLVHGVQMRNHLQRKGAL